MTIEAGKNLPGLKEAQEWNVNKAKTPEVKVADLLDLEKIVVKLENLGVSKSLKKVLESTEILIHKPDFAQRFQKNADFQKVIIESLNESLRVIQEVSLQAEVAGNLGEKFPKGVKVTVKKIETGVNSVDEVAAAIETIQNLIYTFIAEIEPLLSDDQKEKLGIIEKKEVSGDQELKDFSEKEVKALTDKLDLTNDPTSPDYFNPLEKKATSMTGKTVDFIEALQERLVYFESIYSLDKVGDPALRTAILKIYSEHLEPAKLVLERLKERAGEVEDRYFATWESTNPDYAHFKTEITNYETTPPVVVDGSVDVSATLTSFHDTYDKAHKALVASGFINSHLTEVTPFLERGTKILIELQVAQYLFLIKDLRAKIEEVEKLSSEVVRNLSPKEKDKILQSLSSLRFTTGNVDTLSPEFFATQISDIYGVVQKAQDIVSNTVVGEFGWKSRYLKATERIDKEGIMNLSLEKYRKMNLKDLIKEWHTKDVEPDAEPRFALEKAFAEKLEEVKDGFIAKAIAEGDSPAEAEARYENFKNMYEQGFGLVFYGILRGDALNTLQGTARHEKILEFSDISGAMELNSKFNENPMVGSYDLHPGEMYGPHMGILQKIVYAMYQEQRKTNSEFTRNDGYTAGKLNRLIDMVCGLKDMTLWDGSTVTLDIQQEMSKYTDEAKDLIKMFAAWKFSRDDLGSKAGIWHYGRNKGAFKFADGTNPAGMPDGFLAGQCYQVGKNGKFQGHLASLAFITPIETDFMRAKDGSRYLDSAPDQRRENDPDIAFGMNKMMRYLIYEFPELRGTYFSKEPNPITGMYEAPHAYQPENWWEDFPGLDDFFNKGTKDKVYTGSDYIKSRDAVLKIIETAITSLDMKVPMNLEDLEAKIAAHMQNFDTEIGKALAYIGKYNDGSAVYNKGTANPNNENQYNYVHEMILASMKFFILNFLVHIPQEGNMPIYFQKGLKNSSLLKSMAAGDYFTRYRKAIEVMEETIDKNGTLAMYYQREFTGKEGEHAGHVVRRSDGVTPFLEIDFTRAYRDKDLERNRYTNWIDKEKEAHSHSGSSSFIEELTHLNDRASEKMSEPEPPYVFSKEAPFKAIERQHH